MKSPIVYVYESDDKHIVIDQFNPRIVCTNQKISFPNLTYTKPFPSVELLKLCGEFGLCPECVAKLKKMQEE